MKVTIQDSANADGTYVAHAVFATTLRDDKGRLNVSGIMAVDGKGISDRETAAIVARLEQAARRLRQTEAFKRFMASGKRIAFDGENFTLIEWR